MTKKPETTADPSNITVILLSDGKWNWDVSYDRPFGPLGQHGKSDTLDEAMRCVNEAVENGRTKP